MCGALSGGKDAEQASIFLFFNLFEDLHNEIFSLFTDLDRAVVMASSSLHSFFPSPPLFLPLFIEQTAANSKTNGTGRNISHKNLAKLEERASSDDTEQDTQWWLQELPLTHPNPQLSPGWTVESPGLGEAMGAQTIPAGASQEGTHCIHQQCHMAFRSVTN